MLTDVLESILARVGIDAPDERPLYAYRLTSDEAEVLRQQLEVDLRVVGRRIDRAAAAAFCLWASDYFRRGYEGGAWSWDVILDQVDGAHLKTGTGYLALQRMVQDGLQWWRRPLLRGGRRREFLVTLGCEGGLPLHLVQREGHSLRRYFKSLLRNFQAHSFNGRLFPSVRAEDLASRAAEGTLSATLQQQVIFQLGAELVTVILEYAAQLADKGKDPLQELDAKFPGWRDRLPLHIEDDQAQAFLAGLLQDAAQSARSSVSALKWLRTLEGTNGQAPIAAWHLRGRLEFASRHLLGEMKSVFGGEDLPSTGALRLRLADGSARDVARALRERDSDSDWVVLYRIQSGANAIGSAQVAGKVALEFVSSAGTYGPSSNFAAASALSDDLPWIFADESDGDRVMAEFAGEGSTRVRTASAFALLPVGWELATEGLGATRELGTVSDLSERRIVEVRADATMVGPQGERCVLRLNSPTYGTRLHQLSGTPLRTVGQLDGGFLGFPSLREVEGDQPERVVPKSELRWRSALPGATWTLVNEQSLGEGTLRRTVDGEVLFSARICVVPKKFTCTVQPQSASEGFLLIGGLAGADVAIDSTAEVGIETERMSPERLNVRVSHTLRTPPARLRTLLHWGNHGRATIPLPFPCRLSRFERVADPSLAAPSSVAAGTLSGFHAVVIGPSGSDRTASIEGALRGGPGENDVGFIRKDLPELAEGHHRLSLDALRDEVVELLSATELLDASVRLKIDGGVGESSLLSVTRYDLRLTADPSGVCRIETEDWQRLSASERESLKLVAFPIAEPGQPTVPLVRRDAEDIGILSPAWKLPDDVRPSGPWMVLGLDGGWSRLRPRMVIAEPIPQYAPSSLANACAEVDDKARAEALRAVLKDLAANPTHEDWSMMHHFVRRSADLPAPAFISALRELVKIPDAAATLLFLSLREEPGSTDYALRCLESLPFAWETIAADTYAESWRRFVRMVLDEWGGDADAAARYLDRLANGLPPWLQLLARVMTYRELEKPAPEDLREQLKRTEIERAKAEMQLRADVLRLAVGAAFCKVENLYRECSQYADGFMPSKLTNIGVRVAFAPALAALAAAEGAEVSPIARYQVRRVLSRYPDAGPAAFQAAYRFGLLKRWSQRA